MKKIRTFSLIVLAMVVSLHAGQTGKITGRVLDIDAQEGLPGTNVIIEGTTMGAATDMNGEFIILNIPPGTYSVKASMMGYQQTRLTNVKVSVDRTTRIEFKMGSIILEMGESVVVVAEQPLIQKDLTATSVSVSADEIELIPVESFQDVLQLQSGVVKDSQGKLHIRGGRSDEIAFLVDGVSVSDPFNNAMAVEVDQSNIQELKVISGTFNAEYGQVMSGIVEIVTKDPGNDFHAGGSFYVGDYVSNHDDVFMNINDRQVSDIYNAQFNLSGPVPGLKNRLNYYFSVRKAYNDGWLYGQRRFNPSDSSNFQNPDAIYMEETGDLKFMPLNYQDQEFLNAKVVWTIQPGLKVSYNFLGDRTESRYFNHDFKYNPDGDATNHQYGYTQIVQLNHTLSARSFYTLKLSEYRLNYQSYVYENPEDTRYVNPELLRSREDAYSFLTGGTNMTHYNRETTVQVGKFDITSQVTRLHQLKAGFEFKYNTMEFNTFQASYLGKPGGDYFDTGAFFSMGEYTEHPIEISGYAQDKIELQNMTVNIGLRYDYFNSQGKVPVDRRDPGNTYLNQPEAEAYRDAETRHQVSPRLGIAFPLSDAGVVHISYGHFFQIPPYEYLYLNPRFAVAPGGLSSLMGNADLEPQTTTIYEVGFQQEFGGVFGFDITGFYKDARNLLGTQIFETYVLGDRYALYQNQDYGNIKGITLSVNKRPTPADFLTVSFDYSYQIAEGNASDPNHSFYNNQADPPKKSNIQVVALDWDQRHTANLAISYNNPNWVGVGLVGQFQSGLPYTPSIQSQETTFENSGRKPFNYNLDVRLFKTLSVQKFNLTLFVKVYNLLDRKNELNVYPDTGRAGYSLISEYIGERREYVNTLDEYLLRPDYYSEPRRVLFGFDVEY